MNNRLNTQELAELISQYTSKDKKEVEAFLREFVALVVDGVCRDQVVKVKGVGTFKIIQVEKRESIHVNTGERFLIPAHYKFSFLPDKDLREQVNKPFSIFETTEIGDDVDYASFQESDNREEGDEEESVEEVMPDKEIPLSSNDPEERTEDLPLSEEEPSAEKNLRNPLSLWRSLFRPILGPIPILSLSNQSLPLSRHLFLKSRLPNWSGPRNLWVGGVM